MPPRNDLTPGYPAATNGGQAPSLRREALEICAGVIAAPPPTVADIPESDTLITTRWLHPELHEAIPALPVHIIATYYGRPAPRVWRSGNMRLAGTGRPGGIGIVPAGRDGHWDLETEASLSYVMLSDARLQAFADQLFGRGRRVELVPSVAKEDPVGSHLLRMLSRCSAHADPSTRLFVEQALDLLCTHLLRAHSSLAQSMTAAPATKGRLAPWQERRSKEMLLAHIDGRIGLDELAQACGLSRSHFARAFKATIGVTPMQWLLNQRVERAKNLLLNSALPIDEIAHTCGFSDQSHFSRAFLRAIGDTPGAWRRARLL
jgi:AraC family transcriptional regulator